MITAALLDRAPVPASLRLSAPLLVSASPRKVRTFQVEVNDADNNVFYPILYTTTQPKDCIELYIIYNVHPFATPAENVW